MKALSMTQPWASLVAVGAKRLETRSWGTNYRGRIAIHAARKFTKADAQMCDGRRFKEAFEATGYMQIFADMAVHKMRGTRKVSRYDVWKCVLPRGSVIATADLVDVGIVTLSTSNRVLIEADGSDGSDNSLKKWLHLSASERAFGDYSMCRYVWMLDNVQKLPIPIPAVGALGLWDWYFLSIKDEARVEHVIKPAEQLPYETFCGIDAMTDKIPKPVMATRRVSEVDERICSTCRAILRLAVPMPAITPA